MTCETTKNINKPKYGHDRKLETLCIELILGYLMNCIKNWHLTTGFVVSTVWNENEKEVYLRVSPNLLHLGGI